MGRSARAHLVIRLTLLILTLLTLTLLPLTLTLTFSKKVKSVKD